jgi:hypothetical protein
MTNTTTAQPITFNYNGEDVVLTAKHILSDSTFRTMWKAAADISYGVLTGECTQAEADSMLAMVKRANALFIAAQEAGF